jgi:hypothetical protein
LCSLDDWSFREAQAAPHGKNYFTVPYRGQSLESAAFKEKLEEPIETRY